MRKLVEVTHVALGGEIGSPGVWAQPYLDDQHLHYASDLLNAADALLLGRRTYEGLSAAYPKMVEQSPPGAPRGFVDRMNQIPKFVASTTLRQATWNATVIDGDVAAFVADLKRQPGQNLLKYGTGPLDATLMKQGLIDEFHLLLTPVAVGRGQHLFEDVDWAPHLKLIDITRFDSGVVILVYAPE
jgi:dihydrofolate reductase